MSFSFVESSSLDDLMWILVCPMVRSCSWSIADSIHNEKEFNYNVSPPNFSCEGTETDYTFGREYKLKVKIRRIK